PGQARTRAAGLPIALELRLDVLETLAAIPAVGVVAVLVGRLVVAPIAPAGVVRRVLVVGLEVIVVVGGVDRLGDRLARFRADHRADRPGHRTHRRASHRSGDRAGALSNAVVLLHVAQRTALLVWGTACMSAAGSSSRATGIEVVKRVRVQA